jgi:hypothetical protein
MTMHCPFPTPTVVAQFEDRIYSAEVADWVLAPVCAVVASLGGAASAECTDGE